jgi:hypothetical protein
MIKSLTALNTKLLLSQASDALAGDIDTQQVLLT